jgi:beta-lactam-binding protein with PASTA domain
MKFRKAYALAGAVPFVAGLALAAPAMASSSPHSVHAASTCQVPGVVFDPAALAVSEIEDAGLNPVVRGPIGGAFVNTQSPVAGRIVSCGSSVTIVTISGPTP